VSGESKIRAFAAKTSERSLKMAVNEFICSQKLVFISSLGCEMFYLQPEITYLPLFWL